MKLTLLLPKLFACLFGLSLVWALAPSSHADDSDESGFKPIFNGKNLDGWDGDPQHWSVKDGCIVGDTSARIKDNTFLIWREGTLDDFEFRCSYRITSDWGNSGIQFRSRDRGHWIVSGYQADIETRDKYTGGLYNENVRSLALRGQKTTVEKDGHITQGPPVGDAAELEKLIHVKDWNDYDVLVRGYHAVLKINGHVMCDVTDEDLANHVRSGILALQLHVGEPMHIEFKDIRLKRLKLGDRKKVVMVAGTRSHGPGEHEFNAGTELLKKCLDADAPEVLTVIYHNGWPADPTAFDNADEIMLYMDGGGGHPVVQRNRLAEIDHLMKQGVGLLCAHYAVEVPKDHGGPEFLRWLGGYFETYWSINPTWSMTHPILAKDHPITRGVKAFEIPDEWYYHMRFAEDMKGVTPILSAVPPDSTRNGGDGPYSGNKAVREGKGNVEVLSWAVERPDGGRGYGFTGGHYHHNWANDDYRKMMLNAILWVAKAEVPADGVPSTVTAEDLKANLDKK